MMGLCKDCKYWNKGEYWDSGECMDIDLDTFNDMKLEGSDRALYYSVMDDSGLDCGLKTGPEFGCVRFKKK